LKKHIRIRMQYNHKRMTISCAVNEFNISRQLTSRKHPFRERNK